MCKSTSESYPKQHQTVRLRTCASKINSVPLLLLAMLRIVGERECACKIRSMHNMTVCVTNIYINKYIEKLAH